MDLQPIPGQKQLIESFIELMTRNSFPHTSLIAGPQGTPLLAVALQLCEIILTQNVDETRKINTIGKVRQFIHPDLHLSYPLKGSKHDADHFIKQFRELLNQHHYVSLAQWGQAIDGTTGNLSINVLECSAIQRKLSLKAYEGGNRIMLIWGAEYLGQNGNRLLKLMEEPPENTFIILVSENQQQILPTILSRCQNFKLNPISDMTMAKWLSDHFDVEQESANKIASLSEGSVYKALDMIHMDEDQEQLPIEQWINSIFRSKFDEILDMADQLRSLDKEAQKLAFHQAISKLRQAYFHSEPDKRIFGNLKSDQFDLDFVEYTSSLLGEMLNGLNRNAHVPMLFTAGSMKLWRYVRQR